MISILIPTYNHDITQLVCELHKQAASQCVDFEIIVLEDGSTKFVDQNSTITHLHFCKHIISSENIGRAAARNKLAEYALYDHILFMDCDARVNSIHYVEKYLSFCKEDSIAIGGTSYDPDITNPDFSLRLKYGRLREARDATERSRNNFSTFNFLISKSIFERVRFDESLKGYGHEDMLFGHLLHELGYEFIQIENPLIHTGLDNNAVFIAKTEEGVRGLMYLYNTNNYPFLSKESKLLHTFLTIKKLGLNFLLNVIFRVLKRQLKKAISSPNPSLILYDLYKLLYFCHIYKK